MAHINHYGTGINYYSKKLLNKKNYYYFYHGNFSFRKIGNISLTQQTDITNNLTENIAQTINYVGNTCLTIRSQLLLLILPRLPQAIWITIYGCLKV